MGGQGERNDRDSWGDGGDKAEIEERGRDAEQKRGHWQACTKNERKNGGAGICGETRGGEELMLTEERMIKCSPKGANALTAGWRDS